MSKSYWVYILTNKPFGVLYIGITNDIARRLYEHKNHLVPGFTSRYQLHRLVYLEEMGSGNWI
jgi:putative endonuclease